MLSVVYDTVKSSNTFIVTSFKTATDILYTLKILISMLKQLIISKHTNFWYTRLYVLASNLIYSMIEIMRLHTGHVNDASLQDNFLMYFYSSMYFVLEYVSSCKAVFYSNLQSNLLQISVVTHNYLTPNLCQGYF